MENSDPKQDWKTCLILVYGLPGSGKTALSNSIANRIKDEQFGNLEEEIQVEVIDVDSIEEELKESKGEEQSFTPESWTESRKLFLSQLPEKLAAGASKKVIIVDDTVLLRGQRRKLRSMAQKAKGTYCQIFCSVPYNILISRNDGRKDSSKHLKPEALANLFNKFEGDSCSIVFDLQSNDSQDMDEYFSTQFEILMENIKAELSRFYQEKSTSKETLPQEITWLEKLEVEVKKAVGKACSDFTQEDEQKKKEHADKICSHKKQVASLLKSIDRSILESGNVPEICDKIEELQEKEEEEHKINGKILEQLEKCFSTQGSQPSQFSIEEFCYQLFKLLAAI